jgi:GWxTD domain-containing protein
MFLLMLIPGCIAFGAAGNIHTQEDKPLVSSGSLRFYFDKTVFAGKEDLSYAEFYLMFYADDIKFINNSSKGELQINAAIDDKNGNRVSEKSWVVEVSLEGDNRTKVVYDQWNEYLNPGNYTVNIKVNDPNSDLNGELNAEIKIDLIRGDHFSASGIEFVSSVNENMNSEQFRKGSRYIIPNPSRRYGILNPVLFVYYELYGIPLEGNMTFTYSIIDNNKTAEQQSVKSDVPAGKAAIMHGLNISNLPSGVYTLALEVYDPQTDKSIAASSRFEVIHSETVSKTEIKSEDLRKYEALLKYTAPGQVNNYNSLNDEGKVQFIIEFLKKMDPNPGTPENEFIKTMQQRFIYAEHNFGWGGIKGWLTDMGRIVIKYGIPNEVQQFNTQADYFPYQIWIYQDSREYQFVFGDIHNNGRFILLHSNKEDEVSNIYWKEQIKKL